jgi:hypothetical protein
MAAMEELVRPYGDEARSLEGTRICRRKPLINCGVRLQHWKQ